MTQDYDPSTGVSTTPTGAMFVPELIHGARREEWDEHWDEWAKTAIASGSLVPPREEIERRPGNVLAAAFLIAIVTLALAGWAIWGFSH